MAWYCAPNCGPDDVSISTTRLMPMVVLPLAQTPVGSKAGKLGFRRGALSTSGVSPANGVPTGANGGGVSARAAGAQTIAAMPTLATRAVSALHRIERINLLPFLIELVENASDATSFKSLARTSNRFMAIPTGDGRYLDHTLQWSWDNVAVMERATAPALLDGIERAILGIEGYDVTNLPAAITDLVAPEGVREAVRLASAYVQGGHDTDDD